MKLQLQMNLEVSRNTMDFQKVASKSDMETTRRPSRTEGMKMIQSYVWKVKDKEPLQCSTELPTRTTIMWNIAARAQLYQCGTRRCDLCLTEKMMILHSDPDHFLNNRNKLISKGTRINSN